MMFSDTKVFTPHQLNLWPFPHGGKAWLIIKKLKNSINQHMNSKPVIGTGLGRDVQEYWVLSAQHRMALKG